MNINFETIEIICIVVIVVIQLIVFLKLLYLNYQFGSIFKEPLTLIKRSISKGQKYSPEIVLSEENVNITDNDELNSLLLLETKGKNKTSVKLKDTLNAYLVNNYGAVVNFGIIKDMIEREVEVEDEIISQLVPIPLYLGLMATMIGIILGLFGVPEISNSDFTSGIDVVISAVKIAMIASLIGLFFTTFTSASLYKNAKTKVLKGKNNLLSFLQANLLPELLKSEETGFSGLKVSLERFSRQSTFISENMLIATKKMTVNIKMQATIIDKVEKMDFKKISATNLKMFDQLDKNMAAFVEFSSYISQMERVSSQLAAFGERTNDIDKILDTINTNLVDNKVIQQYLSSHIKQVENSGELALQVIDLSSQSINDSVELLKAKTTETINGLSHAVDSGDIQLREIYKNLSKQMNDVTKAYITSYEKSFSDALPDFSQLKYLASIDDIKSKLESLDKLSSLAEMNDKLDNLSTLSLINEIKTNLDNLPNGKKLMSKLDDLQSSLKSNRTRGHSPSNMPPQDNTVSTPEPIPLFKKIKLWHLNFLKKKRIDEK